MVFTGTANPLVALQDITSWFDILRTNDASLQNYAALGCRR